MSYAGKSIDKTVALDNQYELYLAIAKTWPEMMEGEPLISREEFEKSGKSLFEDETPRRVVFTKSGTYMVYYDASKLAVSTWQWENESSGLLRYSWNYKDMYDQYSSGTATVSFSGATLYLRENSATIDDGEVITLTYLMAEVK